MKINQQTERKIYINTEIRSYYIYDFKLLHIKKFHYALRPITIIHNNFHVNKQANDLLKHHRFQLNSNRVTHLLEKSNYKT